MWRIVFLLLLLSEQVSAGNVWAEVKEWKKGDPIPGDLKISRRCRGDDCGMMSDLGLHSIEETQNVGLLRVLVLGKDVDETLFKYAFSRLIDLEGFSQVRSMLVANPVRRKEHKTLRELFRQPIARIVVAGINDNSMPREDATSVLKKLGGLLDEGMEWKVAFRIVESENPDPKRHEVNRWNDGTLVSYKYSGLLTEQRMDVGFQYEVGVIQKSHLERIFRHGAGNLILEGWDGLYLYHVIEGYGPES
jgi:hypothetical protein